MAALSYQAETAMPVCQGLSALHRASITVRPGSTTTTSGSRRRYRAKLTGLGRGCTTYTSNSPGVVDSCFDRCEPRLLGYGLDCWRVIVLVGAVSSEGDSTVGFRGRLCVVDGVAAYI
jgi:hypothetical protein